VGDGIGRTVDPVELREGVQLNCTAEDVTVERQGRTSGAGEMDVGRRVSHGSNLTHRMAEAGCQGRPATSGVIQVGMRLSGFSRRSALHFHDLPRARIPYSRLLRAGRS
jgi:hypothetical protein